MRHTVAAPTPVLTITSRAAGADGDLVVEQSLAALRETARRMELDIVGAPLRVDHGDPLVFELCLMVRRLPDVDPPRPVAAEMLTPGTTVESLGEA